jgi:hypothetical protein
MSTATAPIPADTYSKPHPHLTDLKVTSIAGLNHIRSAMQFTDSKGKTTLRAEINGDAVSYLREHHGCTAIVDVGGSFQLDAQIKVHDLESEGTSVVKAQGELMFLAGRHYGFIISKKPELNPTDLYLTIYEGQ